ncbi:MAG: transaldolase [Gemmatimonadetes bacterium GWC2_71_10]|nr:MAG: transaldolase [Gemmatimonadetes bacterium GWC2_71_10]
MYRASNPGHPLPLLAQLGQSVWLDYIHRRLLTSGELKTLIEKQGVRGVTSNPTIFQQAIGGSDAYDDAIARHAAAGLDAVGIYEALAIEDIQTACDLFGPIYDMAGGGDGFVSMEVSPLLARDTAGTLAEARRLWRAVGRPNVMIKIPGTQEGLPAVTDAIADGINVNITLLFAVERYQQVIDAYLAGLERRVAAGQSIERVRSVASFFVSRVDTEVDQRLEQLVAAGGTPGERAGRLLGTAAIANAKRAYQTYVTNFEGARFRTLMGQGAAVQRPLWASTGTKNPKYADTLYVDNLIGPDTVNTMPPATLEAFGQHGVARRTIDDGVDEARAQLDGLEPLGIRLGEVTDLLEVDGVKKFADSFTALLGAVAAKRGKLAAARA